MMSSWSRKVSAVVLVASAICQMAMSSGVDDIPNVPMYGLRVRNGSTPKVSCSELTFTKSGNDKNSFTVKWSYMLGKDNKENEFNVKYDELNDSYFLVGALNKDQSFKVLKVTDDKKQVYLKTPGVGMAPFVCWSTDHDDVNSDFVNVNCPSTDYSDVIQHHDVCKNHKH